MKYLNVVLWIIVLALFIDSALAKKWPDDFVKRYWCEHSRYQVVEIGYYSGGFATKRKQFVIKYYLPGEGYVEDYCADGYNICEVKAPMRLAKQEYVDLKTVERKALRLDNECTHTHNVKNGRLKHRKIRRRIR